MVIMKLKPLGKKLVFYKVITLVGLVGAIASFYYGWVAAFWVFIACLIIGLAQVISISMSANLHKYDHKGRQHGPDILKKYEPGDAEYEKEKAWQDDGEPLNVNIDVEVTTNNKS
jgi:hypothetical protein